MKAELHYQLDPLSRLDWQEIQSLIQQNKYLVVHAPRQTGKTSTLLAMADALNQTEQYQALYVNIESAQAARNDVQRGIKTICFNIASEANYQLNDDSLLNWFHTQGNNIPTEISLNSLLVNWAQQSAKPTILFIDEIDSLVGDTLISVLRQIRSSYDKRPSGFPQSVILCGVRDVRDYRIHGDKEVITGGSAFNIKSKSLRMGNFSRNEVNELWQLHTKVTGQVFASEIFDELWLDTQGQPWLVNALAYEVRWEQKENRDRSKTIMLEDYKQARESLIYERTTHLDQLSDKLKEPRVHAVIAPMLTTAGSENNLQASLDDLQYCEDLGLIQLKPNIRISNRIYQEVIPRELTFPLSVYITHQQAWYLTDDNYLDMPKLMTAFQQFFRENIDAWQQHFEYKEAGPQLIMQAFLQRIINGGGRISREYALGRKRTDLFIEWPISKDGFHGEVQRVVIELKIQYDSLETTINKGLKQTLGYQQAVGATQAHLVIFNRNSNKPWLERIWHKAQQYNNQTIDIWGC